MHRSLKRLSEGADLVLVLKGEILAKGTLKRIGTPKILWWPDYSQETLHNIAEAYNYVFTTAPTQEYRWLPHGVDPYIHHPIEPVDKYKCDLIFCGTGHRDLGRREWIRNFTKFNLKIYGNDWPPGFPCYCGKAIYNEELSKAYSSAKIVLNQHGLKCGFNMRCWETLACKAFLLTDKVNGMEDVFEIGKHFVAYNDAEEAKELAIYYIFAEKERKRIAEAGYDCVTKNHTYVHRLKQLLKEVGF
jgi:spore maturation protein CgeB